MVSKNVQVVFFLSIFYVFSISLLDEEMKLSLIVLFEGIRML